MTVALVPLRDRGCPDCHGMKSITTIWEPALFIHGGYGATRKTTVESCWDRGWYLVGEIQEVSPKDIPA